MFNSDFGANKFFLRVRGKFQKKICILLRTSIIKWFRITVAYFKAMLIIVRRLFQSSVHAIRSWYRMEGTGG